jgi:1-acyl-sn-glycerol-3-phosphate acyltransferase
MPFIRFLFRSILFILSVVIVLPLVLLLITIAQKKNKREFNKKVVNYWSKFLCFVCGLKLNCKGKIQKNPVLIVANHISWVDIPVIHCYKLVGYVAKAEIENWPFLGLVAKCGESLFIKRGKQESRQKVLESIKQRLNNNRSIAVFPEGKATNGEYLGRFHRQLLHAAVEEKKPIQAIAIKYINKDGSRNKGIAFKEKENFLSNVFRILSLPTSTAELTFCDVIDTSNISARQAAIISHNQVEKELEKNDYM